MCRLPSLCPWWWMMVGGGGLMTFSAKLNFILSTEVMSLMRICYSNTLFYSSSKTWSSNALFYSSSKAHHFNDRKRLCSCRYKLMSLMRIYSSKICSFKPLLDHVHVYVDKNWENEKKFSSKASSTNALFSSSKPANFNYRKRLCSCRYKLMSLIRIWSSCPW